MSKFSAFLSSSIGKKLLMALTGLFLVSFMVAHLTGNLQLFKDDFGLSFNQYAVFMTSNPLIKTISYGLYAIILFHAFQGLYLAYQNKMARPIGYAKVASNNAPWYSRSMALLGTIILVFIVVHMSGFWYQYKFGSVPYTQYQVQLYNPSDIVATEYAGEKISEKMVEIVNPADGTKTIIVKDLYKEVSTSFKQLWIVIIYVLSMVALAFHLIHGFKSAFQTLGINHPKYNGIIKFLGIWVFGLIFPILFASMPLYFYFIH